MIIKPIKTKIFQEGECLIDFIIHSVKNIPENSVLVVTSKIVALAEGRTALGDGSISKEKLIRRESDLAMETKYIWLTVKDDMVMASAGIDESNANGKFILLPTNSFKAANILRTKLKNKYGIKNLGIIITDSRTMPFRSGVTGVALGYAGFCGIKDYRGKPDIFGRKLKVSQVDVADSLAAAAVLEMGEGNECQPLALIKEPPVIFKDKINKQELHINLKDDMYGPIFSNAKFNKKHGS
jgi:coenzyme F420-0:L-glutamate ligase